MLKGVREIMMFVPDIREAKVWYSEFLGIEPSIDEENYCQFKLGGVELGLHPADEKMGAGGAGTVAYWEVGDLGEVLERAQVLGAKLYRGPKTTDDSRKICQIIDPFGNVLGLVQVV